MLVGEAGHRERSQDMDGQLPGYDGYFAKIMTLGHELEGAVNFGEALDDYLALKSEIEAAALDVVVLSYLRFALTSMLINVAYDRKSIDGLAAGLKWTYEAIADPATPAPFVPQFQYNCANAQINMFQISERADAQTDSSDPTYRIEHIEGLREARQLLATVGDDDTVPGEVRSTALCNLANALDESGRWVEAYTKYAEALEVDPTNGNAAGNLAELLRRRLIVGHDQRGHIAAVYDHYVVLAQSLRARTAEIAGEAAAVRWDDLQLTGSQGHLSHAGDELDDYQLWIVNHRLALVAAVEGLGSDSNRWDSATLTGYVSARADAVVPPIYAAMNVLKAEYLTARRLGYRGQAMIWESIDAQHPEDTGEYADTMDGAIYGEAAASLLLAQRSALDVLDKIAVTANEYFGSGQPPHKVAFATFWVDEKTRQCRPALDGDTAAERPRLALAELATDVHEKGMYAIAKLLRNAGTHRLVHATWAEPTGPTRATFSTVDLADLMKATVEALSVTRAAYLYLIDLIQSQIPSQVGDEAHVMGIPLQV
jgi:tetratricopeptide (TPR) repeat protein